MKKHGYAFSLVEADLAASKTALISVIAETIRRRGLSKAQAAKRCGVAPDELTKALSAQMMSVLLDNLLVWLTKLGHEVEIRVKPCSAKTKTRRLSVVVESALRSA